MTKDKSIFIKNIYYMLAYAFAALRQDGYKSVAGERFENPHNLFAAILARGIGIQLKQGLYREYLSRREDVSAMRGKIDLQGAVRNRLARKRLLTCEYGELSENNPFNQILKTTAILLMRHPEVEETYKTDLKRKLIFFSEVSAVDPPSIRWAAIRFQRNNHTYRMLLGVCQLVLEGMLLTTGNGEYRLASFVDEQRMSRLYEKFILEYFIREYPQIKTSAPQIPWALDDGAGTLLPVMQSDVMLRRGNTELIIDAKYYTRIMQARYDADRIRSEHLYQIFSYVKNEAASSGGIPRQVSGMLLYAGTDEAVQPDCVYQMSGNKISVKTLDLNREFSEIAEQLNQIVEENFGTAPGFCR